MAVIGRVLEAQGFRVGIIAQPDWLSAEPFKVLGKPNLFWGVTAGNMDSMINRYTADRKIRSDDAYTPGDVGGAPRPRRHRLQPALPRGLQGRAHHPGRHRGLAAPHRALRLLERQGAPLHRVDAKCDLLLYGNAERAIIEVAHRLAAREPVQSITDVRGTAFCAPPDDDAPRAGSRSTPPRWTSPAGRGQHVNPYLTTGEQAAEGQTCAMEEAAACAREAAAQAGGRPARGAKPSRSCQPCASCRTRRCKGSGKVPPRERTVIRLPSYEQVQATRCCMPTPTACCTWRPTPATPARWCRPMARAPRARCVDQPAAHPADHGRDGPGVRPALRAQRRTRSMPTRTAATTAPPRSRPGR
jgi:radical SAM superfamily enzyme YgiQ (UPF0313 family)